MAVKNATGSGDRLRRRKRPKACAKICYHFGAALFFVGLIVTIVGFASTDLFQIFVYDNRHPAIFHHIVIHVGLFAIEGDLQDNDNEVTPLEYPPILDEPPWIAAKVMAIIGACSGILALIVHFLLLRHRDLKPWKVVLLELLLLLAAVIGLLIGISLAESEIEEVHNSGDEALTRMLQKNKLLALSVELDKATPGPDSATPESPRAAKGGRISSAEFDLMLSRPLTSFYVLIAADFLLLLGFLAVLVFFVRVCEEEEENRKQLQKAKVASAQSAI
uniref:Uncharacterized protein n=1 Tax=Schistocephalus solidus TaxID=70667 RepID=A0A0X3NZV2_SCHSO